MFKVSHWNIEWWSNWRNILWFIFVRVKFKIQIEKKNTWTKTDILDWMLINFASNFRKQPIKRKKQAKSNNNKNIARLTIGYKVWNDKWCLCIAHWMVMFFNWWKIDWIISLVLPVSCVWRFCIVAIWIQFRLKYFSHTQIVCAMRTTAAVYW